MPNTGASARIRPGKGEDPFQIQASGVASLVEMQKELLDTFEQIHRDRLARTLNETKLASEFAANVSTARSIPELMALYQDWIAKHVEMFGEDGRKFLADSQKIVNATVRLLSTRDGGT